jgi:hypothetical protein
VAAGFGPFTDMVVFINPGVAVTRTLVFADGSTLVLDETVLSFTPPGNSGASAGRPPNSFGHPGTLLLGWTASGTGDFAAADGSGTETLKGAGAEAKGSLVGTI